MCTRLLVREFERHFGVAGNVIWLVQQQQPDELFISKSKCFIVHKVNHLSYLMIDNLRWQQSVIISWNPRLATRGSTYQWIKLKSRFSFRGNTYVQISWISAQTVSVFTTAWSFSYFFLSCVSWSLSPQSSEKIVWWHFGKGHLHHLHSLHHLVSRIVWICEGQECVLSIQTEQLEIYKRIMLEIPKILKHDSSDSFICFQPHSIYFFKSFSKSFPLFFLLR